MNPARSAGTPGLVEVVRANEGITVTWTDGATDTVTPSWLRDACHCAECRGPTGGQRRFDLASLPDDLRVAGVALAGQVVDVRFADGHRGRIPAAVLGRRRAARRRPRWGAEHADTLRRRCRDHRGDLAAFLSDLDRYGVAMVDGLAAERGQVNAFAERFGFVRETNYGRAFDVQARPDPSNLADSTEALALHTDNPYRDPVPTLQLLHCLTASGDGGATRLVDGWAAVERLAGTDPDAVALLARYDVPFRYLDDGVDLQARGRLIELDHAGNVVTVRMNNRSMEPVDLPAAELERFYAAYRAFATTLSDPAAVVELALAPGELVAFDNRRVLHGRTGYPPGSSRLLQGCYADIDAVRSAVRVAEASRP